MKKYLVQQANLTASGSGDYWDVDSFDTLKEARECMRRIYDDTRGLAEHFPNGYLHTIIINAQSEEDIVDSKEYYY